MKRNTLYLTKAETELLKQDGAIEIYRGNMIVVVNEDDRFDGGYRVDIINPYTSIKLKEGDDNE